MPYLCEIFFNKLWFAELIRWWCSFYCLKEKMELVSNHSFLDVHGRIADKRTTGGWKASSFIIGTAETSYRYYVVQCSNFDLCGGCRERGDGEVGVLCNCSEHGVLFSLCKEWISSRRCHSRYWLDWSCLCAYPLRSLSSWCLLGSLQNHLTFLRHLCCSMYYIFQLRFAFCLFI